MRTSVRQWTRGVLSVGAIGLLFAVAVACAQAPDRSEPHRVELGEGSFRGELMIEETTMRRTQVRASFVELPAGSYEAYFSSDACETREGPVKLFMRSDQRDTTIIEMQDQNRRFSSLATGAHYLGIEAVPLDDSALSACIPLAP